MKFTKPSSDTIGHVWFVTVAMELARAVACADTASERARMLALVAYGRWRAAEENAGVDDTANQRAYYGVKQEFFRLFSMEGWNEGDVSWDEDALRAFPSKPYLLELIAGAEVSKLDPFGGWF